MSAAVDEAGRCSRRAAALLGHVTRGLRIAGSRSRLAALNTIFPWLAHNAMMHLTVPHGLEQYTGAAWGTRDVCQGPVEFLLALEHDEPVKDILRIIFAQQYEAQRRLAAMVHARSLFDIQDRHSHGDVIVWPLKALCDYLEATNDLAFLDEPIAWRREDDFAPTTQRPIRSRAHVDKLLATVRERFIPGTQLIRYGEGDWNDSLQPADPTMRDWMVSSWTVALLYQQLGRYARGSAARGGRGGRRRISRRSRRRMRADFNRYLIRDGTVAGYALFEPDGESSRNCCCIRATRRTGLRYSLLPMTRAHHRGAVHARAGAAPSRASSASTCCFPTARG